jgi:DNA-binding beta-propeller fold protein YncE
MRGAARLLALLLVLPSAAAAEIVVPPGFTATVYVTGEGFDEGRRASGLPSISALVFDAAGTLYVSRAGRRYVGGEIEDVWPIFRFPPGGARLNKEHERTAYYGPPLPNPQVAATRGGEVLVTTYDRDRVVGVLYRVVDGRAELLAGGTPPSRVTSPTLKQPEGVAFDAAGNLLVADRQHNAVMKLDPAGKMLDPRWLLLPRPRLLVARGERLWVAADGDAEAPWQRATGEIWSFGPEGRRLALRGPLAAGMDLSPGGHLVIADRPGSRLVAVGPDATTLELVSFTEGDAPRALAFAPTTEATRRAGIAGDLFVVVIRRSTWSLNEIVRISGPLDDYVRRKLPSPP